MCVDPSGGVVYYKPNDEDLYTLTIYKKEVQKTRQEFPFLGDAHEFELHI